MATRLLGFCFVSLCLPAAADDHWAFQRLSRPAVPEVKVADAAGTPIDAFLLAPLGERGLSFSPQAEPRALVRRIYFDLIGLPPSPDEIDALASDASPDAYERLLDRLLASPHFGPRWGRHWLDNAGYADVYGGDNDAAIIKLGENKWLYRDYVVRSLNSDKPFDQFLVEQLAGDELIDWRSVETFTPETADRLVATGFLRNSADDTNENELNTLDIRYGVVHRTIEMVAGNLLGLTLQCAKCHDHKYEPITQRDYYQLQAIFQPALNPDHWLQPQDRQLPALAPHEKDAAQKQNADVDRQIADLRRELAALHEPHEQRLRESKLAGVPEVIREDVKTALATEAEKRTELQKYLAEKFEPSLKVSADEVAKSLSPGEQQAAESVERRIKELTGQKKQWQHWQVIYDVGPPTPTRLLTRGNHLTPADEVPPGTIAVLAADENALGFRPESVSGSSGRRLALAKWLTDTNTPAGALALRVRVNRIWQQLFGRGIVETSDNFGVTGAAPSHQELLEWLACDFVSREQRLKPFLRSVMQSSAYRQSSAPGPPAAAMAQAVDPDNNLLWKQRLRRLESEAVRDAILAVSGALDRTLGGPPIPVEARPDGSVVVKKEGLPPAMSPHRRSIYLLARRNYHPTLLAAFDQPHMTTNCAHRSSSAVVLQSLTMLNDEFVLDRAEDVARRVAGEGAAPQARAAAAFKIVLGRAPTELEARWCQESLAIEAAFHTEHDKNCPPDEAARRALVGLCHTLLNTSEFLYIP